MLPLVNSFSVPLVRQARHGYSSWTPTSWSFSTPRHSMILFPKCLKNLIMFIHSGCHHPGPSLQHPLSCFLAMSCFWSPNMFHLPWTHFSHGSQCDGWKMPVWFLSMLLSTTQCFPFLLEWRLKSPTLPTNPCAGSSCHLSSLLSLSMFQLTHFFPLTHYFFSCSFWNNFRHAKRCKNSAKIFHLCFTQLP